MPKKHLTSYVNAPARSLTLCLKSRNFINLLTMQLKLPISFRLKVVWLMVMGPNWLTMPSLLIGIFYARKLEFSPSSWYSNVLELTKKIEESLVPCIKFVCFYWLLSFPIFLFLSSLKISVNMLKEMNKRIFFCFCKQNKP